MFVSLNVLKSVHNILFKLIFFMKCYIFLYSYIFMKGSPVPQLLSILKDLIECSLNANVYLYLKSKAILIAMNDILRFFSKRSLFYAVS